MKYQAQEYARALHEALQASSDEERPAVLDNFARLLHNNSDLHLYPTIEREYELLAQRERGVQQVTVTTARELNLSSGLVALIKNAVGNDVAVTQKVDAALIGGIVVRAGDTLIDASIRGRLAELQDRLRR